MAKGLDYIRENYPSSDIVILISDCFDSLEEWRDSSERMKGQTIYVFNYGTKWVDPKAFNNIIVKNFNQ